MRFFSTGRKLGIFSVLILTMVIGGGCAKKSSVETPESVENGDLAPLTTMVESYGDIELPIEMILDNKKSISMRTDSFQGGIHVYKGRVEIASLRDYIIASMRNNKWKLVGEATYDNVMLAFTKPNKTCMVVLQDARLNETMANFYVTVDVAAASRLNPFGEPITK